jgi:hypothetical protein
MRVAAKLRARIVALLGIVVPATTFVARLAIVAILPATRLMEDLFSVSVVLEWSQAVPPGESIMSEELDAIRKTLQAHADELQKRSGIDAAVLLLLSVVARDLNLTADPDKTIEKLKTTFLFSRLQDREIEAAIKALEMILKSRNHPL